MIRFDGEGEDEGVITGDAENDTAVDTEATVDENSDADDKSASESDGESESKDEDADGEGDQDNPDAYADFDMQEGFEVNEALLEAAVPLFQELGLTQEQAQKLVDFQTDQVKASSQSQTDAFNEMVQGWQADAMVDSEFGGDAFEQNASIAQEAVAKFGTPELKELLNDHGLGNHPEMIRFMWKVGTLTKEDSLDPSDPLNPEQDRLKMLYPNDRTE